MDTEKNTQKAKNYIDPEDLAKMVKRFGGDVAEEDSLNAALDRVYIVNDDQVKQFRAAERAIAKQRTKLEDELKAKVATGELDEDEAEEELSRFRPSGIRLPKGQVVNLLVMGDPGGGKTSIIEQWGENKGVKIVKKTAADITASVSRGLPAVDEIPDPEGKKDENGNVLKVKQQEYLPSTFFDALDDPEYEYTVLFVDEINRGHADAESAILTLVCDHTINNRNYRSGRKKFSQYLFTVAAANPPANSPEARKLSLAMATRFRLYIWNNSPEEFKKFIDDELDNNINIANFELEEDPNDTSALRRKNWNQGRREIIDTLIDAGYTFSDPTWNNEVGDPDNVEDPEDIHVVNARTLMTALYSCDGTIGIGQPGTHNYVKGSFMDEFKHNCTSRPDKLDEVELVLSDLNDDMTSRANGFQQNIYFKYTQWFKKNGAKYGLS